MKYIVSIKKWSLSFLLLLCGYMLTAQTGPDDIRARFTQYASKALQEKLYVHTDKDFYLAGEIIWFKLYNVDGTHHRPLDLSKVAYVELLDKDNKPAMQGKIALSKGQGDGSFFLPASIPTGNYLLRAYTNWMKNFGADYFFHKPVHIVNTFKAGQPAVRDTTQRYDVQFLPEGGHLVKGIESKVAFRVTNQYGKGQSFSGMVLNENNDTLLRFHPHAFGMGHFLFTPDKTGPYRAVITLHNGETIYRNLPAVQEQGYVLRVTEEGGGNVQAVVTSSIAGDREVYLFVHTRQDIKLAEKKSLQNGMAVFSVNPDQLGEGISHFTVFDQRQQPVCERLYFKRPNNLLQVKAGTDLPQYGHRKTVTVNIQSSRAGLPASASLSLSVYRADSLQQQQQGNIFTWLWLSSDLKGMIESPEYYFSENTPGVREALDNLMLVHGWRRFNWNSLLVAKNFTFDHAPEFDGHIISGRIVSGDNATPLTDVRSFLSVPGYPIQFYTTASDGDGIVRFDVRNYFGRNDVVLQADVRHLHNYRIEGINPFHEKYALITLPPLHVAAHLAPQLRERHVQMQVHNTYDAEKISQFAAPEVDTLAFYGIPSRKYWLDDYVRFTTMEEVLREYVPEVAVRRREGQLHLLVFHPEQDLFFNTDPLILLDGVPVTNEEIMSYDPLKVKKLEVVTEKYINGLFTYDGIVSFTTYHGDLEDFKLNPKAVKLDYEGLQLKREFYAPAYETPEQVASRLPDFRNVLYWSPDITTDDNGNAQATFYTSDIKGRFVAILEGLDEQGNAGSCTFSFEVTGNE